MEESNVKEETKNEDSGEDEEDKTVKDEVKETGGGADGELRKCTFCDFTSSAVR